MASGGSVVRLYKRLYQWSFLAPLIGAKGYIITQLAIYKWYISGIYCQLGDYINKYIYISPIKGTRNSYRLYTPPKTNIEPENRNLEDYFPFARGVSSGSIFIFGGCSQPMNGTNGSGDLLSSMIVTSTLGTCKTISASP